MWQQTEKGYKGNHLLRRVRTHAKQMSASLLYLLYTSKGTAPARKITHQLMLYQKNGIFLSSSQAGLICRMWFGLSCFGAPGFCRSIKILWIRCFFPLPELFFLCMVMKTNIWGRSLRWTNCRICGQSKYRNSVRFHWAENLCRTFWRRRIFSVAYSKYIAA